MWLINVQTQLLEDFTVRKIPRYAILSHTWTDEEVTFQEFLSKDGDTVRKIESKKGLIKIMKTCELAARHNIGYIWVDTCCIDKSSSAELSEAINSMWRYYKDAEVCYAYLSDLPQRANVVEELKACKWFTRGWTLQELIAPKELGFYDGTWHFQGTKYEFAEPIHQITKIPPDILRNPDGLAELSIAERMTWASNRETTRIEDIAYCLLGIFDINMPLLYGEGNKAFIRLQQEIIKNNNDLSIFGWCPEDSEELLFVPNLECVKSAGPCKDNCGHDLDEQDSYSVLPPSPKAFARPSVWDAVQSVEHSVTNRGIKIDCSLHQACLRGCYPNACRCCSHCRKYVLVIGEDEDISYGIMMKKTGPDAFIRSKNQLINVRPPRGSLGARIWQTRHRPIYLLTKAPYTSPDSSYGVPVPLNFDQGELEVNMARPESNWDFAKRLWHVKDHMDWGIVGFWFVKNIGCRFYVLFLGHWGEVSILDSEFYKKEIALLSQDTSTLTRYDVVALLNLKLSGEKPEKDFHVNGRAVRVKANRIKSDGTWFLAVWTEDVPAPGPSVHRRPPSPPSPSQSVRKRART